MSFTIIIPTLGRCNNQLTYNGLPQKYQEMVHFVVQSHEFEIMKEKYGDKVKVLPTEYLGMKMNNLPLTREWIQETYKDTLYYTVDDDVLYKKRIINEQGKYRSVEMNDEDYDTMFNQLVNWSNEGIVHCGVITNWIKPSKNIYPINKNGRIMTNHFFNGKLLPKIDFMRTTSSEDLDCSLQLFSKGYENRSVGEYIACVSETNSEGGCSIYRTLDKHNASNRKLAELWPKFVKAKEKDVKSGVFKGQKKVSVIVYCKKALKSSGFLSKSN